MCLSPLNVSYTPCLQLKSEELLYSHLANEARAVGPENVLPLPTAKPSGRTGLNYHLGHGQYGEQPVFRWHF